MLLRFPRLVCSSWIPLEFLLQDSSSNRLELALAKNQDQDAYRQLHAMLLMILTGFGSGYSQFRITWQSQAIQGRDTGDLRPWLKAETLKKWILDMFEN